MTNLGDVHACCGVSGTDLCNYRTSPQRMGVPETNRYVELAHAVVYLNSLANEVSYACRFHHADILPRTLDAIACTVAGQADGDEVELDEETSEQYRRAERAVHAAQLDLQASIAIEIGDQPRMDELEAQAAAEGCPQARGWGGWAWGRALA